MFMLNIFIVFKSGGFVPGHSFGAGSHAPLQLCGDKVGLAALTRVLLDVIREEKQLQHDEDDKQFNQDDKPQRFAETHIAETVVVEKQHAAYQIRFQG